VQRNTSNSILKTAYRNLAEKGKRASSDLAKHPSPFLYLMEKGRSPYNIWEF